jgi:two-component sensor histidine kinase/putative methionine-R-sulfoxide reductase with GAF domain
MLGDVAALAPEDSSMPRSALITPLTTELSDELSRHWSQKILESDSQAIRLDFERFAAQAVSQGILLEEAMASAGVAINSVLSSRGEIGADSVHARLCGVGLGAIARVYLSGKPESKEDNDASSMTPLSRLSALHRINRTATANLQLGEMLETTVRVVAESTGNDSCAVFLYDAATDTLALRAAIGLEQSAIGAVTIRPGIGITGRAAAEGQPIIAVDAQEHPSNFPIPGLGFERYSSQASIPMMIRGANRLVGVLNILSSRKRSWDEDDVAFFQTVAGELAISIENARLYSYTDARLRRKVNELGTLQRVSRKIASSLDLGDVLRSIVEAAVELTQSEAAAIMRLPGPDEEGPVIEYRFGNMQPVADEISRADLITRVIETGTSHSAVMDYMDEGQRRLFCVPLQSARKRLGALCLRLRDNVEMTEEQLGLLQSFSDSAAIAIENAQLYEDLRGGLETTSALLQEMHHRVRNNLQTVAALLSLQIRQAESEKDADALREAAGRIQAIAAVHDLLSDERRLSGATIDQIARLVAEEAHSTMIQPGKRVTFVIPPSDVTVPSRTATILALLINELVSNAVRHGFRDRDSGEIAIRTSRESGIATLEVENNGVRVPDGFNPTTSRGLGMRIVHRLVTSDLRGYFTITATENGTLARITFPVDRVATIDRLQDRIGQS